MTQHLLVHKIIERPWLQEPRSTAQTWTRVSTQTIPAHAAMDTRAHFTGTADNNVGAAGEASKKY